MPIRKKHTGARKPITALEQLTREFRKTPATKYPVGGPDGQHRVLAAASIANKQKAKSSHGTNRKHKGN